MQVLTTEPEQPKRNTYKRKLKRDTECAYKYQQQAYMLRQRRDSAWFSCLLQRPPKTRPVDDDKNVT